MEKNTAIEYARPQVDPEVHRQARMAALQRGVEFRIFLSQIIPLGIQALEEQERRDARKDCA